MTKTLTEQWKDGELDGGYYYYKTESDKIVLGFQYKLLQYPYDCHHNTIDDINEVLSPVPSYDEYKELVSKTEQLEKKLEIATNTLKSFIPDDLTDGGFGEMYESVILDCEKALTKMEGVK